MIATGCCVTIRCLGALEDVYRSHQGSPAEAERCADDVGNLLLRHGAERKSAREIGLMRKAGNARLACASDRLRHGASLA